MFIRINIANLISQACAVIVTDTLDNLKTAKNNKIKILTVYNIIIGLS